MNRECLELEDLCASLKKEVLEAWDSYKGAQEKAAVREDELQDEIKQIQKAKSLDRQQMINQITKLTTDMEEALEKVRVNALERDQAYLKAAEFAHVRMTYEASYLAIDLIGYLLQIEEQWQRKLDELSQELLEARSGSMQGVHTLREELAVALQTNETIRSEHASILRLSQSKQAELEQANAQLSLSLAEKQREISKLKAAVQDSTNNYRDPNNDGRDLELLQLQVSQLNDLLDNEKANNSQLDRYVDS